MAFQKAERKKARLRLALCGPSGSGKTYSAILIAQGLGGKIAMIDTENGSGDLYAELGEYYTEQIRAPYEPAKYIAAIHEAEAAGFSVIIIDSLSHAWAGEGGLLDQHDKVAKASKSGNTYTAWREITPLHNRLVDAILQSPCHIISCMRTKTAYEIVEENGKKAPKKIGMAPVQRDGMEYEFTCVLDLSIDGHIATSSKDRTGIFDGKYSTPTIKTGMSLAEWLDRGVETIPEPKPAQQPPQTTPVHKGNVGANIPTADMVAGITELLPVLGESDSPDDSIPIEWWNAIKSACTIGSYSLAKVLENLGVKRAGEIKKSDVALIKRMLVPGEASDIAA